MLSKSAVLLTLAACAAESAAAGVVVDMVRTNLETGRERAVDRFYVQDAMLKVEPGAIDETYGMIFRDDSLYVIDHEEKTYQHITGESIRSMATQINPMLEQMREQMKNLPAEQRERVEQMMRERMGVASLEPPSIDMLETSKTATVGEFQCRIWDMAVNGERTHEVCIAPAGSIEGGDELAAALRGIARFQQGILESLGAGAASDNPFMNMTALQGVPVQTIAYQQDRAIERIELQHAEKRDLDDSEFLPPQDYEQLDGP